MKIVAVALLSVLCAGCASTHDDAVMTTLYTPNALGGQIGEVRRIEDVKYGVVSYYIVQANGNLLLGSYVSPKSKLITHSVSEAVKPAVLDK